MDEDGYVPCKVRDDCPDDTLIDGKQYYYYCRSPSSEKRLRSSYRGRSGRGKTFCVYSDLPWSIGKSRVTGAWLLEFLTSTTGIGTTKIEITAGYYDTTC